MLLVPLSFVLAAHLSSVQPPPVPELTTSPTVFRFQSAPLPPASTLARHRFRPAGNRFARKASAACVGSLLGMMAGALVGAGIDSGEGDSKDMFGIMVGGGVGAALGGVAGWKIAR